MRIQNTPDMFYENNLITLWKKITQVNITTRSQIQEKSMNYIIQNTKEK